MSKEIRKFIDLTKNFRLNESLDDNPDREKNILFKFWDKVGFENSPPISDFEIDEREPTINITDEYKRMNNLTRDYFE